MTFNKHRNFCYQNKDFPESFKVKKKRQDYKILYSVRSCLLNLHKSGISVSSNAYTDQNHLEQFCCLIDYFLTAVYYEFSVVQTKQGLH